MIIAEQILPWKLDAHDCAETIEKLLKTSDVDVADEEVENLFLFTKRKTYVLRISRRLVKVQAFQEEVGELKGFFSYETGGGAMVNYGDTAKTWRCIADSLVSTDMVSGECTQSQTWVHETTPEIVDMTEFTTAVPEPEA